MATGASLARFRDRFNVITMQQQMPDIAQVETMNGRAYQYATARPKVTLELPMESFFDLVKATEEFDKLEQDSVTADLIKEAKFVYKLKYGT
jgi:hypothetical protein